MEFYKLQRIVLKFTLFNIKLLLLFIIFGEMRLFSIIEDRIIKAYKNDIRI